MRTSGSEETTMDIPTLSLHFRFPTTRMTQWNTKRTVDLACLDSVTTGDSDVSTRVARDSAVVESHELQEL